MSALPKESFFDAWDTYAKVVAGDYMFHREIGAALNRVLRARFEAKRFSMLDLGCGDAATLAPVLEGLRCRVTWVWTSRGQLSLLRGKI